MHNINKLMASLYVPATMPAMLDVLSGAALQSIDSVIVCMEDAISDQDVPEAMRTIRDALALTHRRDLDVFIRPRNPAMLRLILQIPGVTKIAGFVLPKADSLSLPAYLSALSATDFLFMPTLETSAVFSLEGREELRRILLTPSILRRIPLARIGGNDLLGLLGLKRTRGVSIYETPIGHLISQIVMEFYPYGIRFSGVVCDDFRDLTLLAKEARQDRLMGLVAKTAIHPTQVAVIRAAMNVSHKDLETAQLVVNKQTEGPFSADGVMLEPAVHLGWARELIARSTP